MSFNLKVGDKVEVIAGKSKGTVGKIIKTYRKENKVIVEGANLVTKHVKPSAQNENGGIIFLCNGANFITDEEHMTIVQKQIITHLVEKTKL